MLNWSELTDVSSLTYEENFQKQLIKNYCNNICSMRIRGMDEETGTASDDLKDMSKNIKGLTGISVFTDETNKTYKSTFDILKQISGVYNTLSDKSQAEVLELLAGKRQGNVVAAALKNFSSIDKAMTVQANSAGGAMREQATVLDSVATHVNTLKETFVGLGQSLLDSGFLKGLIDIGTTGVSGLKGLIDTLGTIPTLAGAASIALSAMSKNAGISKEKYAPHSCKRRSA